MGRLRALVASAACVAIGAFAACAPAEKHPAPGAYAGTVLARPLPKPSFVLTSMTGAPYDFRRETDGNLTLLFFGYTHCPDVCPVHLANLAAVMGRLPIETTSRVRVVFVTTDPARDTPERLREWLGQLSPDIVGLTGTLAQVRAAQIAAGVTPAEPVPHAPHDTTYAVGHAGQVIAYTPDDLGRVMYPFGTRQSDWAHDIPLLLGPAGGRPVAAR